MGKLKQSDSNYSIPGTSMTADEMQLMLKKAENGKFHSLEVLNSKIKEWKVKYKK